MRGLPIRRVATNAIGSFHRTVTTTITTASTAGAATAANVGSQARVVSRTNQANEWVYRALNVYVTCPTSDRFVRQTISNKENTRFTCFTRASIPFLGSPTVPILLLWSFIVVAIYMGYRYDEI